MQSEKDPREILFSNFNSEMGMINPILEDQIQMEEDQWEIIGKAHEPFDRIPLKGQILGMTCEPFGNFIL